MTSDKEMSDTEFIELLKFRAESVRDVLGTDQLLLEAANRIERLLRRVKETAEL